MAKSVKKKTVRPVRKNIAHISKNERKKFIKAILELGDKKFNDGVSYWFKQDQIHQATHVHGRPSFLPWHRELLNRFEAMLQEVDDTVALHYWDWRTDPRRSPNGKGGEVNLFSKDIFGASDGPAGKPFAGNLDNNGEFSGSREESGSPGDPTLPPMAITRRMAPGTPPVDSDFAIIHSGDNASEENQWTLFRRKLEVWPNHDRMHGWVGGTMGPPHSSFEEPFVFVMHSNIDRLWAMWQCQPRFKWRLDPERIYGIETNSDELSDPLAPWAGGRGVRPWAPPENSIEAKNARDLTIVEPPPYDTLP